MKRWFWRTFASLCIAGFMTVLIVMGRLLIINDISVTPVDFNHMEERVYVVTYADGKPVFFQNQNALAFSALNRGVDFIFNYKRHHISPDFVSKNKEIMNDPVGVGRWLWKPYLILETMKRVPEGSYIIYLDTGFVIRKNIIPLLKMMGDKDIMAVAYDPNIYGVLGTHCHRQSLILSTCDTTECREAPHLWAGLSFYRNSPKSRAFVEKWLQISENPEILLPGPGKLPEYPEFKYHHNDESTFSITGYLMKQDITFIPDVKTYEYVPWHHRRHAEDIHKSLLHHIYHYDIRKIDKEILKYIDKIRSWIKQEQPLEEPKTVS